MSKINKPISQLNKVEFDEGYEEMLVKYKDNFDKYPLPTRETVLKVALERGELSLLKYKELL